MSNENQQERLTRLIKQLGVNLRDCNWLADYENMSWDVEAKIRVFVETLAESSTQQAPYKGPINGPCSACSAGDTAMEHHNHERAQQAPEPRDEGASMTWWCCRADYPDHEPSCKNYAEPRECEYCDLLWELNPALGLHRKPQTGVFAYRCTRAMPEEMARTSDNVIELAGKAVRACGGEKSKTILVARILDVELEAVHAAHLTEQAKARADKDGAYEERNRLVALLSSMFPSSLERHPDEDLTWSDDWRWVVYIDFPYGQASWHIHDSQLSLFDHLKRFQGRKWDGHSTEQKYASVAAMTILMQENETRYAAEQAKAQEDDLGICARCLKPSVRVAVETGFAGEDEYLCGPCISIENAQAEQTSLASQAKAEKEIAQLRFSIGALNGALAVTERTLLASQAKARHLQDQLWCQALAYAHTGPNCTLDDGWEEEGRLERRKDLILRSPLMEEVLKKLTDETIAISLASQAKLIRNCAEIVKQGPHAPQCKTLANHSWIVPEDCDCGTSFTLANIVELITPAMLQAEEAALAAEKGLEAQNVDPATK